jgi:hypothetical protein
VKEGVGEGMGGGMVSFCINTKDMHNNDVGKRREYGFMEFMKYGFMKIMK